MSSTTTNLALIKPAVNSPVDEDLWGDQLNTNMDTIDSEFAVRTINQSYNDKVLSQAEVKDLSESVKNLGNISGAVLVDYLDGHWQHGILTGNITGLTINNLPVTTKGGFLTLELTQDATGSRTIDLTGGVFRSTAAITLTTTGNAIDKLRLETRDAGTFIDVALNANFTVIT